MARLRWRWIRLNEAGVARQEPGEHVSGEPLDALVSFREDRAIGAAMQVGDESMVRR
jgi:hypothetical protein